MKTEHPDEIEALRDDALEIFRAGLDAADPFRAVTRHLVAAGAGSPLPPGKEKLRVIACGKAATSMAAAAAAALSPEVFPGPGLIIVPRGSGKPVDRFEVLEARHPLPDRSGVEAARRVLETVGGAGPEEAILVLISGGSSALLPAPAPGISLEDKVKTTSLLLAAGADIGEVNAVRKHLSVLKGGWLARAAGDTPVRALVLSDVLGDHLSVIASGPLAPDPSTFADALAVLHRREVIDGIPPAVRSRLEAGDRGEIPETPKPGDASFRHVSCEIVGGNGTSVEAARRCAARLGYRTVAIPRPITGEAREEALDLHVEALGMASLRPGPVALVGGGETTVTVRGSGRGGRNQELALAFALAAEESPLPRRSWAFLSAGTDGIDGPTDAAGGLVDPGTPRRMRSGGIDPLAALTDNDSHRALVASGDIIRTGPTGTNVADLMVYLAGGR